MHSRADVPYHLMAVHFLTLYLLHNTYCAYVVYTWHTCTGSSFLRYVLLVYFHEGVVYYKVWIHMLYCKTITFFLKVGFKWKQYINLMKGTTGWTQVVII